MTLYLLARIAGRPVAIESAQIQSVVDVDAVVPAPRAVAGIVGLTALRSRVITVVDPRVPLGLPPVANDGGRAIVGRIDGHDYAFLVDALDDVVPFNALPLTGMALGGGWHAAATGIIELRGEPIVVLDLTRLVPMPLAA